jgi:sialate O-acetylesterase
MYGNRWRRIVVFFLTLALVPLTVLNAAELRMATVFSSHMVLQRDMPVPVWGSAAPGSLIAVAFKAQRKTTHADADGRWRVVLDPESTDSEGTVLEVESEERKVRLEDVVLGDVWLCAGPGFSRPINGLQNPAPHLAEARFPGVRLLRPDSYTSVLPVSDFPAPVSWVPVSPETVGPYPVTWYFGRELHRAHGVPVGLIVVNRPGMGREWLAWTLDSTDRTQADALRTLRDQLPRDIERAESWLFHMQKRRDNQPIDLLLFPCHIPMNFYGTHPVFGAEYPVRLKSSLAYNANVGPLVPMALRGVLFQCEFDEQSYVAADDLKRVVESWRAAWGRSQMPFVFCDPVLNFARAAQVEAALQSVMKFSGVSRVPPAKPFSDHKSEDYWRAVAGVAKDLPLENGIQIPAQVLWASPVHVGSAPAPERCKLEAAHVFGDNMVLQRDQPLAVWGWSEPGEQVTVSFAGERQSTTTDDTGRWRTVLAALPANENPQTLWIETASERLKFENVLVGEVWVNSGQSNAGFVMSATLGFDEEQPRATNPAIRCFFNVKAADVLPQRRNLGEWRVLSPETVGRMSGMGYYFAKSIHRETRVPVGIIEANHGGSSIYSWTTEAALASVPEFASLAASQKQTRLEALENLPRVQKAVQEWVVEAKKNADLTRPMMPFPIDASPVRPFYGAFRQNLMERRGCMFFNAMIQPMVGFGMRGVLWNQGEADGSRAAIYDKLMATMVADWRRQWGHEFPFYFVQMPARSGDSSLLAIWQAQTRALAKIPHSGMVVCNDISEAGTRYEVHPRDKRSVGERLARLALVRTYGVQGMVDSSPMMQSVTREPGRVVVTFSSPGEGLRTRDNQPSTLWELAGADGKFNPARAEIVGAKVFLEAADVPHPVAVRFGWKSDSNSNLINSAGLPALPFTAAIQ